MRLVLLIFVDKKGQQKRATECGIRLRDFVQTLNLHHYTDLQCTGVLTDASVVS